MPILKTTASYSAISLALLFSANAHAQQAGEKPVDLGSIKVVEASDKAVPTSYESFDPIDSGTSIISARAINVEMDGSNNTTDLLKKLPNVQMDIGRDTVPNERNIQDIRPADFTISGGNFYNNNIMIDGVQANSIMDVTNGGNPFHFAEPAGTTAQTIYIDPALLERITVIDSNVSAEFGDFTGGVVNFEIRDPGEKFGVSVTGGYQSDSLTKYVVDEEDMPDDPNDLPDTPSFDKKRVSISIDIPVTEDFSLLASYARSDSAVTYIRSDNYGGDDYKSKDVSENFLLKGIYDFSDTLTFEGQVVHSPYESEAETGRSLNALILSRSGGLSAYGKLSGVHNDMDWQARIAYANDDTGRTAPNGFFSWSTATPRGQFCGSTRSCSEGGFGDVDREQKDITLDFKLSKPIADGLFRLGGEYRSIDAEQIKHNTTYSFRTTRRNSPVPFAPLTCDADDFACVPNEIYLNQRNVYAGYAAQINVKSNALWAEYERDFDKLTLRGGLRYSHENHLDNSNFAPRLTAAYEIKPDWFITAGANRYYGKNMVAYAMRSQQPGLVIETRPGIVDAGGVVTPGPWEDFLVLGTRDYAEGDLDTPYSDELTLALTAPTLLDGTFRLKGVKRKGRDQFASSPSESIPVPGARPIRRSTLTNDGASEYESISAEWLGRIGRHTLAANFTWSDTKVTGAIENYFDVIDLEELAEDLIYYGNELITEEELNEIRIRSNFATPYLASIIWSTNWFNERLTTSASAYYRSSYDSIADSRDNITIDGERYDIYELATRPSHINVDLNAQFELFENTAGRGVVDLRIDNLLNDLPHTIASSRSPYQQGRSAWVGFSYKY